jgi:hypothetical protein
MSELRFKQALVLIGLAMLFIIGSMFSSAGPVPLKPPATAQLAKPSPTAQLANQLVDRVNRLKDRAITACSGVVAHTPQCKQLRETANHTYSNVVASVHLLDGNGLMSLSRAIDAAETEVYPHLRTLEASSKTIENILSGR